LRDFCAAAEVKYNAKDPAGSYTEAEGEGEKFSPLKEGWGAHFNDRLDILSLLNGLRKRHALASVELRAVRRPD
jgi:hypothetical protein